MNASELSKMEYDWWVEKTSAYLGRKIYGLKLFKDEIGVGETYYKKSDITQENPIVECRVVV